ncbi:hypothetical protein METUNv1_00701 [Methyloversatilis universalis FAM5]|uniref:Uncharacterized protein n=1 Tax=Methyloversatilis universalis (strain ATCC BAA-1314 / DSM 25237 / JCM 13912 / CCUG 52030 / FAM5) TaxID=1000565 RepID=F5R981_METUF|nr:hypothetical protein METUNv1_00701 [Methyloversatilis universalis FAM5]
MFSACLKSDMPTEAEMNQMTPCHGAERRLEPSHRLKSSDTAAAAPHDIRLEVCHADH